MKNKEIKKGEGVIRTSTCKGGTELDCSGNFELSDSCEQQTNLDTCEEATNLKFAKTGGGKVCCGGGTLISAAEVSGGSACRGKASLCSEDGATLS
jgi:hypothetical protein